MKYKNCGVWAQTFHGVTFKPGEIHEVNGYINAKHFIRVSDDTPISKKVESSQLKGKRGRPPKDQRVESQVKPAVEEPVKIEEEETKQPVSSFNLKEEKKDDDKSKEKE